MSTKSLLLASVAYIAAGIVAGGLLANGAAITGTVTGKPENLREAAIAVALVVSNKDAKHDRLVLPVNFATAEPVTTGSLPPVSAYANEPSSRADKIGSPVPLVSQPAPAQPKPKQTAKRQPIYALLSDEQIASVKERMKLTPFQEQHWPAIEAALHKIAARLQRSAKGATDATPAQIDPNSPEVEDLKTAAMPLLFTLSEDQKREVRTLARVIGLEAVASAI